MNTSNHQHEHEYEVIIVGGGAAGLSAALVLGRARRTTLLIDAGRQSNIVAHGIGGLLGHNERPPAELYAIGRAEVSAHPTVTIRTGEVVDGERIDGGYRLELGDGTSVTGKRVLLATGMDYSYPDLPGIPERWGRSVFHCPFCHGWEVRDRPLGVLANGPMAGHRALLLRFWSDDVTLYTGGPAELDTDDARRLAAAGIRIDERGVVGLAGDDGGLSAVVLADGEQRPCNGLLVPITLHQRSKLADRLGAVAQEPGMIALDAVEIGPMMATSADGVFAAGDLSSPMPSVANSIAAGSMAAAGIVQSLLAEYYH